MEPGRSLNELRMAFALLTRLPTGLIAEPAPALRDTVWAYPVTGLGVGLIGAVTLLAGAGLGLPQPACAAFAVGAMALATGAMHEDGLADTADGFGGGSTQERKLEIKRDSRIGSYGVLALVIVTMMRIVALTGIEAGWVATGALIAAAMASRAVLPVIMMLLPPTRRDGLGRSASQPDPARVAVSVAIGLLAPALLLTVTQAIWGLFAAGVVVIAISFLSMRQISGFTGDTLGATQILGETAFLLTAVH